MPQEILETYCRTVFAGNPAGQSGCISRQMEDVAELSRSEPGVDQRITDYCAGTFGDSVALRELCIRDQSAVLERLRRNNSERR